MYHQVGHFVELLGHSKKLVRFLAIFVAQLAGQ